MQFIPLIFFSVTLVVFLIYVRFLYLSYSGLKRLTGHEVRNSNKSCTVDIIISFYNARENLPALVDSLNKQNYTNFRVIWVNDGSTDGSESILADCDKHFQSVFLRNETNQGKKASLAKAVDKVKAGMVLFTDADCVLPASWIATYMKSYDPDNKQLFFGPVLYHSKTRVQRVLSLELLSLVATGLGLSAKGKPVFMNGANYAVHRGLLKYFAMADGQRYRTGDDVFLLHIIKKSIGAAAIQPLINKAVVETRAPENLWAFLRQRVRWGSKATGYKDRTTLLLTITVFSISFLQVSSLTFYGHWPFVAGVWIAKWLVDYLFLNRAVLVLDRPKLLSAFPLLAPVYPFYIVLTGIAGLFRGKDKW